MLINTFASGWCFGISVSALIEGRYLAALSAAMFGVISFGVGWQLNKFDREVR